MSKQQLKLLATVTPEKPRQEKSLVQVEGKLTEEELKAISKISAEGQCAAGALTFN